MKTNFELWHSLSKDVYHFFPEDDAPRLNSDSKCVGRVEAHCLKEARAKMREAMEAWRKQGGQENAYRS